MGRQGDARGGGSVSGAKNTKSLAELRRFKPYPSYKDSGVEWVREIPAHWAVAPVCARYEVALGKMLDAKRVTGEFSGQYLRNIDVQWDRVNIQDLPEMDFPPRERERYMVRSGDLLVCEGGEVGRTAIWRGEIDECFYQKALHRVRPRSEREAPRFFYYLMSMVASRGVFAAIGNQNTIDHLTAVQLKHYRFPFAPEEEQRAIAAFLDRETARIDTLVTKKERLIELLQEQRTALITRAVTKGLDPNIPMKNSGVEWLGAIPAHWGVNRTKFAARLRSGHTPSRQHPEYWQDCTIPWFGLADVWQIRDGRIECVYETTEKISELGLANSAARLLPMGTVILSRTASVGFSAVLGVDMATTQDFVNWVCGPTLRPEYLLYVFRSMEHEFRRLTMGSTHQTIYMPDVGGFSTPIPPLPEQDQVVAVIRKETVRIDALVAKVGDAIDRLSELRAALICAAVTGKIDVREEVT
jgi:type I restriction enzyme, S subunit